ncbi:MAG: LPXTG cell wall anchor domain-containing protein [Deltaproteobacteria bacterium]|nr:MAG: LPXTG cell wall anchor domain-containing protein [Deltaproteobacteria bacterium]
MRYRPGGTDGSPCTGPHTDAHAHVMGLLGLVLLALLAIFSAWLRKRNP